MFWVLSAILIIVGGIVYSKRKGTVSLSKEQWEMVSRLIHKELTELKGQEQGVIDNLATQGKTISIEDIFSKIGTESDTVSDTVKREIEKRKKEIQKELLDKYGPNIPIDVFYRVINQLDPNEESPWSDNPGCFERHLQRREGNLLFPPERRIVTKKEIDEAREKDLIEQELFGEKVKAFLASFSEKNIPLDKTTSFPVLLRAVAAQLGEEKNIPIGRANALLREVQKLLEEAASIGGNIEQFVRVLESQEETLMRSINDALPEGADILEKLQNVSIMARNPYFAQSSRKDSPILKEEELPTLLSEDLETISVEGYKSRAFAPDYRPNETDIRNHLDEAISSGFSKERADQIIAAWKEMGDISQ